MMHTEANLNPYQNRQIKSSRNERTLDFFIKCNPANDWRTLEDAARFTYETNKPHNWQIKAVHTLLSSICKNEFYPNPDALLEYSTEVNENHWSYRLLNAEMMDLYKESQRIPPSNSFEELDF